MRDLKRYPITLLEMETALIDLANDLAEEESIGDMRPLLLRTAATIISRLAFALQPLEIPHES